jgi:hypothetical protein
MIVVNSDYFQLLKLKFCKFRNIIKCSTKKTVHDPFTPLVPEVPLEPLVLLHPPFIPDVPDVPSDVPVPPAAPETC